MEMLDIGVCIFMAAILAFFVWVYIFTGGSKGNNFPPPPPPEHKWGRTVNILDKKPVTSFEKEYCCCPMPEEPKQKKEDSYELRKLRNRDKF